MLDLVIFSWYPANLKTKQGKKCHENFELSCMLQWDEKLMEYSVKEIHTTKSLTDKKVSLLKCAKSLFLRKYSNKQFSWENYHWDSGKSDLCLNFNSQSDWRNSKRTQFFLHLKGVFLVKIHLAETDYQNLRLG